MNFFHRTYRGGLLNTQGAVPTLNLVNPKSKQKQIKSKQVEMEAVMMWSTVRTNTEDFSHLEPKTHITNAAKWLWRFSNFYGEYTALPPWERQKMVGDRLAEAKKRRRNKALNL
jgi:hypothetical protein